MADIDLIKSKLDIVEVIGSYIQLKKAGSNFRGLCPFHNEKTPSFMVNQGLQIYKCFGCGKGGDIINFVQEIERLEFVDALKMLAEKAGVKLDDFKFTRDPKIDKEKKRIIEANTLVAKYYNYILKTHAQGKKAREYASGRKINGEMIEKFMFGYAPKNYANIKKFLAKKGFKVQDLVKWGLLADRDGKIIDKFRDRLMQPIYNIQGEIVGFSGRYIGTSDQAPKYLNSPETLVYKKNNLLYGLYHGAGAIRKNKYIILVEGNIDVVSSHRVKVENIAAPLGTAFTREQGRIVKRFADLIYFCFDTDQAGTAALIRGLGIAEDLRIEHKVIDISGFQDADDLICRDPSEWKKRINEAKNTVEYLIQKLSQDLDLGTAEGKSNLHKRLLPVLRLLKNEISLSHYIKQVSLILEITESILLEQVKDRSKFQETGQLDNLTKVNPLKESKSDSYDRKLEAYFLSLLLHTKSLTDTGAEEEYFLDASCREIFINLKSRGAQGSLADIKNGLAEDSVELLENIVLFDISRVQKIEEEVKKIFNRVYEKYLRKQILILRKSLAAEPDNKEKLKELDYLGRELNTITR